MTSIDIGDVVVLNSGGPKMTVLEVLDDSVRCAWTTDAAELEVAWFRIACVFRMHSAGEVSVG